jgi:hypothetical protein
MEGKGILFSKALLRIKFLYLFISAMLKSKSIHHEQFKENIKFTWVIKLFIEICVSEIQIYITHW